MSERAARLAVRARSAGRCEVCGAAPAQSVQHRVRRGQGGTWATSNLLDVCGDGTRGCHGWITAHPAAARAVGWDVPTWHDAAAVPVLITSPTLDARPVWAHLGDDRADVWRCEALYWPHSLAPDMLLWTVLGLVAAGQAVTAGLALPGVLAGVGLDPCGCPCPT